MPKSLHPGWIVTWLASLLAGCLSPMQSQTATAALFTPTRSATATLTATAILTPTLTPIPSVTSTPEPVGCLKPPEDYTRVEINGWTINRRTLAMLAHAQELYGGELDVNSVLHGSAKDD